MLVEGRATPGRSFSLRTRNNNLNEGPGPFALAAAVAESALEQI